MNTIPTIKTTQRRVKPKTDLSVVLLLLISSLIVQLATFGLVLVAEFRYREQRQAAQELIDRFQSLQAQPEYDWEAEQKRMEREQEKVFKAIQECFDDL